MVYYLINCRSLTYAQRAKRILERAGISAYLIRTPQSITGGGCSHSVKVTERSIRAAVSALQKAQFPVMRIFSTAGGGVYSEVVV